MMCRPWRWTGSYDAIPGSRAEGRAAADTQEEADKAAEDLLESFQDASVSRRLQWNINIGDWLDVDSASTEASQHRADELSEWLDKKCGFQSDMSLKPVPYLEISDVAIVQTWAQLSCTPDLSREEMPTSLSPRHCGPPNTRPVYHHAARPLAPPIGDWSPRAHPGASTSRRAYPPKRQERVFIQAIHGVMEENDVDSDVLDVRWHAAARAKTKSRGARGGGWSKPCGAIGKQGRNETKKFSGLLLKPNISARLAQVSEEVMQQSDSRQAELVARGIACMLLGRA